MMKIVLICNTALPEILVKERLNLETKPESWILGHINNLQKESGIKVVYGFPVMDSECKLRGEVDGISYFSFHRARELNRYSDAAERTFKEVFDFEKPDVIHIFGSEFSHTLGAVNAASSLGIQDKVVISIQGLVSVIAQHHYCAGLPRKYTRARTFRDIIRKDSVEMQRNNFAERGNFEKEAIKKVNHVVGRTEWDKACVKKINPEINYHFCNETLRNTFYDKKWRLDACEKHSIFVSQSNYPLKGFHKMLEAMAEIVKQYPDAHLYTTGQNPCLLNSFSEKIRKTTYQKCIADLIREYGLQENVTFLGFLNEKEMCNRYLQSHVFITPSSIENSSNSVGEAMILGVPTISADVGGIKNLVKHGEEGFIYPFDETYMIAFYVEQIFSNDEMVQKISENAMKHAMKTHDRNVNAMRMLEIYREIAKINN